MIMREFARLRGNRRLTSAATGWLGLASEQSHPDFRLPLMFLSFIMEPTLRQFGKTKKPTVGFLV
jgi:hypothetical protein